MIKMRINLRKVAMMIACLAVTTMFVACDKDGEGGDGKIDQKLVGVWIRYHSPNSILMFRTSFYHTER